LSRWGILRGDRRLEDNNMPYKYLDDMATADVAFQATGKTREEMCRAASDAVLNVMLASFDDLVPRLSQKIFIQARDLEMLLFQFLQELIFLKDAQKLLLRVTKVVINENVDGLTLRAEASGEEIDSHRHDLRVDIKAVTMHRFQVKATDSGWEATVVLDI